MQSDFLDAHDRHWQDAEMLYSAQRLANADHLYGMAVECGLKRLMLAFGMPFDDQQSKPVDRKDQQHAERIWVRYDTYRSGFHQGTEYGLSNPNPFGDWHASQRYASQSEFSMQRVAPHRVGAQQVYDLVRKARWEGLI